MDSRIVSDRGRETYSTISHEGGNTVKELDNTSNRKRMVEENIFDHILYEFQMYVFTYYQVYVSVESKRQVYMNLLLDSHMLHLRNVANFFDVKKQKKNYIHISDCLKNGTELMIENDKLRKIYQFISASACHLTIDRVNPNYKSNTRDVELESFRLLSENIRKFLELTDDKFKTECFTSTNS